MPICVKNTAEISSVKFLFRINIYGKAENHLE